MKEKYTSLEMACKIWILTSTFVGIVVGQFQMFSHMSLWIVPVGAIAAAVGSLPVFVVLVICIPFINRYATSVQNKYFWLLFTCLITILPYAGIGGIALDVELNRYGAETFLTRFAAFGALLFLSAAVAMFIINRQLTSYFSYTIKNNTTMEQELPEGHTYRSSNQPATGGNKILIKGFITGALTLIMLIPALFIMNLVTEREDRQKAVTTEISNKWAAPQTLSGPYIYLPYQYSYSNSDNKIITVKKELYLLPENLSVKGTIIPELRQRSIYSVLLYKTDIKNTGNFLIKLPKDITPEMINFTEAKVCFNIRDFKGIQDKISINLNGTAYELSPGLPAKQMETIEPVNKNSSQQEYDRAVTADSRQVEATGLSSAITLSAADLGKSLTFDMPVKINGSEQLHFIPLAGNSKFELSSTLADPNFDGNNLPAVRTVTKNGFAATWNFNKANLPFGTALKDFDFKKEAYAFGVTLVQPADQYAKTMRSVKYAILFIGLTFALFFIIELMQKNPVHPVQYVLVGIALVIFFTLLLSISEFLLFDFAYLIAATATILLISLYAKGHFKSTKTAFVFGGVLTCLYSFIFVLISLEDTALLVGSIGLFIVLAIVMYASRKINWYGRDVSELAATA